MTATVRVGRESRRDRTVATVLSVAIHLLLIGAIAWILTRTRSGPEEARVDETPIEFTIVEPEPIAPSTPQFVRTDPSQATDQVPKNAAFESDNNTSAASELPPEGTSAVPTTAGEETLAMELQDRAYTAGLEARPSSPSSPPPTEQAVNEPPKPAADPAPPTQLALREAPPKPVEEPAKPEPRLTEPAARPMPPSAPGFQPQTRVTRLKGNISNRGKASVEAAGTPLGRYKKTISDAIGSRWYYYVNNQIGLLNIGTVSVRFVVMPDGKVKGIKVLSNSSNESFASVSVSSIVEAEIPPIPEEVAKLLENSRIEIDYSFTILSN